MSIKVTNLIKKFETQNAVNDISFEVEKGQIVGFLGPNGAGKSTTMKILTGYLPQTSGAAFICGLDVSKNSLEIKRKIGYLPENNPLYKDMYVKEYLTFVANVHKVSNVKNRVIKTIEDVGLVLEQNKKIEQLSKGYKQRVGIAQAIIHNPEVLILDEPTSGLDPNQLTDIRNLIKTLGRDKTVLLSTHILQEVENICDRIVVINKGKIVGDDYLSKMINNKTNNNIIIIEFLEKIEDSFFKKISNLDSFHFDGQYYRLTFKSSSIESKKEIFKRALEFGYTIISLTNENKNLEDVFKELTINK